MITNGQKTTMPRDTADHSRLRTSYSGQWTAGAAAFTEGTIHTDPIPAHGDDRWGLSFVIRIEDRIAERIATVCAELATRCEAPHLVYARRDLHVTVRTLEGYQDAIPREQARHYGDQLRRVLDDLDPIEIHLKGLSGSPAGLFVSGYPTATLYELRRRLGEHQYATGHVGTDGGDGDRIRDTAHVSVLVPRPPAVPEPRLVEYVKSRSDMEFGTLRCASVSLVRYRPDRNAVNLTEIDRVPVRVRRQ